MLKSLFCYLRFHQSSAQHSRAKSRQQTLSFVTLTRVLRTSATNVCKSKFMRRTLSQLRLAMLKRIVFVERPTPRWKRLSLHANRSASLSPSASIRLCFNCHCRAHSFAFDLRLHAAVNLFSHFAPVLEYAFQPHTNRLCDEIHCRLPQYLRRHFGFVLFLAGYTIACSLINTYVNRMGPYAMAW